MSILMTLLMIASSFVIFWVIPIYALYAIFGILAFFIFDLYWMETITFKNNTEISLSHRWRWSVLFLVCLIFCVIVVMYPIHWLVYIGTLINFYSLFYMVYTFMDNTDE